MKLSKNSKRLGIFIFFDRDSIIDDYVIYMLDSLNEAVNKILFVSNSPLDEEELKKLNKYNIDINIRENKGLDAGAFKYIYDKYSKDYICNYDELILLNDTFFGPFKPFKDIINDMSQKDIDFWGLTANFNSPDGTEKSIDGYIHSHIQTYFVAYRKNILESDFFNNYWKNYNIDKNNSFVDVVNNHESYFTYLLEKEGYKWDTYIDLSHYKDNDRKNNYNIYGYSEYTLLKYFNCPFIKRKNFVFNKIDAMYLNDGTDTSKSLRWIKDNTNYDINMIYKNISRIYDPYDIYQSLNLNYIISDSNNKKGKRLIIANINDEKSIDLSKLYFDKLKTVDILLYTENKKISNSKVQYVDNLYKFLINGKDNLINKYDYICLLNLKDDSDDFQEIIDSNLIRILENLVLNDRYINGIIDVFENNAINILFAPESFHNKNIMNLTGRNKRELLKRINKRLSLNLKSNKFNKSFDGLWIKSNVLNNINNYDISYEEFISLFELFVSGNLYGKIYNKEYIESDILSLEIIYNYCVRSKKSKLSFPNTMIRYDDANIFRKIFRIITPISLRRKLKKMVRK